MNVNVFRVVNGKIVKGSTQGNVLVGSTESGDNVQKIKLNAKITKVVIEKLKK